MQKNSNNILGIAVLSLIFSPLAAQTALACNDDTQAKWHTPDTNKPTTTIKEAISSLAQTAGVAVGKSEFQSKCSSDVSYTVRDKDDGQYLGEVPVPNDYDSGNTLMIRVQQLLSPSKEHAKLQMKNLDTARKAFREDNDVLRLKLGVHFYAPNALPLDQQFVDGKQRLYATAELCEDGWYMSSDLISRDVFTNTHSYIPGRIDYSEDTIYKKGDLQKELFASPLHEAFIQRAEHNAKACTGRFSRMTESDWNLIAERLKSSTSSEILKPASKRFAELFLPSNRSKNRPVAAELKNKNTIVITYAAPEQDGYKERISSETIYGDKNEIRNIEYMLVGMNITTDRTHLDRNGNIEKDVGVLPPPPSLKQ